MWKSANVGPLDRALRVIGGVALAAYAYAALSGPWAIAAGAAAAVLLATALVRFCPAYRLLGIDTCRIAR